MKHLPVFSPYSLAMRYGVPMWSDEHFELIEQSFRLMAELNARRVDIDMSPVIRAYWSPPEHCMFRLVPGKDGPSTSSGQAKYGYDFAVVDRMLDTVEKAMKKPQPLVIAVWGWKQGGDRKGAGGHHNVLLAFDPATGTHSTIPHPPAGSEENYAFWKPILDTLRERIEKRGWWDVTALGHQSYASSPGKSVKIAKRIWPDAVWSYSSHCGSLGKNWGGMPIRFSEGVWTAGKLQPRGYKRLLKPGRDKSIWNFSFRNGHRDNSSLKTLLHISESAIMRGHDGLGYLCVDFFPVPHPTRKKHNKRILDSKCGNILGNSTVAILAAGPKGLLVTGRYEAFRYGTYRCEAVLYLQRALDAKRVSGDLAKRVNGFLDTRSETILKGWHRINGLWDSDRELFALAAEVQAEAVGDRPASSRRLPQTMKTVKAGRKRRAAK